MTALGAEFPQRPVRFVVPYVPGAINDLVARTIALRLSETWPQQVVVDNRGGGGTIIGTDIVARSAPDGHTLLLTSVAHAINPGLHARLPYDTMRDFAYVTLVGYGPFVVVVHPNGGIDSMKSLIAAAKGRPAQLTYGSSGVGGGAHLAGELLRSLAGIDIVHVPYKGGGPAITDVIAGQVSMTFATLAAVGGHVRAGRLRALAVTSLKRSASAPDLPTVSEACCAGYEATPWWGVAVPAATPRPVVEQLNRAITTVLRQPDIVDRFRAQAVDLAGSTPAEATAHMASEIARWARVIRQSGARAD